MGLGKETLLPAYGINRQPEPPDTGVRPAREVPAAVMAAAGVSLQETLRLLQVGPTVQAVPTVPADSELFCCCNRLKAYSTTALLA